MRPIEEKVDDLTGLDTREATDIGKGSKVRSAIESCIATSEAVQQPSHQDVIARSIGKTSGSGFTGRG